MALLCPYCSSHFDPADLIFRCANMNGTCTPEPDTLLDQATALVAPPLLGRTFRAPSRLLPRWLGLGIDRRARCSCGVETSIRLCPHCHQEFPAGIEETDTLLIPVLGARESGKSHFIGVLLHELRHRAGARFRATLNSAGDRTRRTYDEHYARYLFRERRTIPPSSVTAAEPLIYQLSIADENPKRAGRIVTLVFYDVAGPLTDSTTTLASSHPHLADASALLFVIDPLQIPSVRPLVATEPTVGNQTIDALEILSRVDEGMRTLRRTGLFRKTDIPIAVTFTKMDTITAILPAGSAMNRTSSQDAFFDVTDFEQVNAEMQSLGNRWIGVGLEAFLQQRFFKHAYFGVSALGHAPKDSLLADGIAPFRVADPLLWLLYELDVLAGRRRRSP